MSTNAGIISDAMKYVTQKTEQVKHSNATAKTRRTNRSNRTRRGNDCQRDLLKEYSVMSPTLIFISFITLK